MADKKKTEDIAFPSFVSDNSKAKRMIDAMPGDAASLSNLLDAFAEYGLPTDIAAIRNLCAKDYIAEMKKAYKEQISTLPTFAPKSLKESIAMEYNAQIEAVLPFIKTARRILNTEHYIFTDTDGRAMIDPDATEKEIMRICETPIDTEGMREYWCLLHRAKDIIHEIEKFESNRGRKHFRMRQDVTYFNNNGVPASFSIWDWFENIERLNPETLETYRTEMDLETYIEVFKYMFIKPCTGEN